MNDKIKRLSKAVSDIASASLCLGAAAANLEVKQPRWTIAVLEINKAEARLDEARTVLARLLLDEGGLQR
jgi:hypothetical protein